MHCDIAVSFVHCPGWTSFGTRSIFALVAERGEKIESNIWKLADCASYLACPENTSLQIIFALAGNNASPASCASLEVYYHRQPFGFRRSSGRGDLRR
jgi:hypothetical protein